MERHSENALKVAQFLDQHPKVTWVNYPGLENNKYHSLAKSIYLKDKVLFLHLAWMVQWKISPAS